MTQIYRFVSQKIAHFAEPFSLAYVVGSGRESQLYKS